MIPNRLKYFTALISLMFLTLQRNADAQTFVSDFSTGNDGWTGDFADYPVSDSLFYELQFYRAKLPSPLDTNQFALMISGNNHSDDLFMFIKRKITGLSPNSTYQLFISVDFASKYPTNAIGAGGTPGEGVRIKAGATLIEPAKIIADSYYRMNIDKDNQSNPGADMDTIGHVGVTDTTTIFTIINRNNSGHLFTIKTDSKGEVWICIGTDSGFEATTTLYYKKITLTFNSITRIDDNKANNYKYAIHQNFPNPFNNTTTISYSLAQNGFVSLKIYNILGNEITTLVSKFQPAGKYEVEFSAEGGSASGGNAENLPSGFYLYEIKTGNFSEFRKLILLK